jgi:transposase
MIPLSPIAIEIVRRIDALFEIERSVNGKSREERLAVRQNLSRPLVDDLRVYMREQAARLSRGHDLVKAVNYILKRWPAEHPRWTFHFTPTSASWLNAVEGFFSTITRRKIRRGVFKSVAELQDAIERYIKAHNKTSNPFVWTASASAIFEKLAKIPVPSE